MIVGLATGEQGSGLAGLWGPVGQLLDEVPGIDVVADCGRLYAGSPATDVLQWAGAVVLVARPSIESVAHLRARATAVLRDLDRRPGPAAAGVRRGGHRPARRRLAPADRDGAAPGRAAGPVLGRIALDPKGAGLLSGEWIGRLDQSLLGPLRPGRGRPARPAARRPGRAVTAVDHAVVGGCAPRSATDRRQRRDGPVGLGWRCRPRTSGSSPGP